MSAQLHVFESGSDVYLDPPMGVAYSSVCKLGGSCSDGREWFGLGVHIYVCNPPSDLLSNLTVNTTQNDDAHNKMMPQAALQREKKMLFAGNVAGETDSAQWSKKAKGGKRPYYYIRFGAVSGRHG